MTLTFRNVDVPVGAPVSTWPYEAIVTAIERGTVGDWTVLTIEFDRDPWGDVARQVEQYLSYKRPWGVAPLLERAIARARRDCEQRERAAVSATVRNLVEQSGLSMEKFARRIGTSRSRLSTYRSGRVTPSAALVERMRRLVDDERRLSPSTEGKGREGA